MGREQSPHPKLIIPEQEVSSVPSTTKAPGNTAASTKAEALDHAQAEIRHLKQTVGALREELESAQFQYDKFQQDSHAKVHDETQQLKETIIALRDEFERLHIQSDEKVQEIFATANSEAGLLKDTILALRDGLDTLKMDSDRELQTLQHTYRAETEQLQDTIKTVRQQLESSSPSIPAPKGARKRPHREPK